MYLSLSASLSPCLLCSSGSLRSVCFLRSLLFFSMLSSLSWVPFGCSWALCYASSVFLLLLGAFWVLLGAFWEPLGGLLGTSWGTLGRS